MINLCGREGTVEDIVTCCHICSKRMQRCSCAVLQLGAHAPLNCMVDLESALPLLHASACHSAFALCAALCLRRATCTSTTACSLCSNVFPVPCRLLLVLHSVSRLWPVRLDLNLTFGHQRCLAVSSPWHQGSLQLGTCTPCNSLPAASKWDAMQGDGHRAEHPMLYRVPERGARGDVAQQVVAAHARAPQNGTPASGFTDFWPKAGEAVTLGGGEGGQEDISSTGLLATPKWNTVDAQGYLGQAL